MNYSSYGRNNGYGLYSHHNMQKEENMGLAIMSTVTSVMSNNGNHTHIDHSMGGYDHSMGGDHDGRVGHLSIYNDMKMFFHAGYSEIILFESWNINSLEGLVGSMIGIILMAILYEGLKYYREYLIWKTYNALQYRLITISNEKGVLVQQSKVVEPTPFNWMHAFQTFLHFIQIVLSYFLMLIFMTYNIWLCIAIVLGAAIGYFLFGWKKPIVMDVTEHCH